MCNHHFDHGGEWHDQMMEVSEKYSLNLEPHRSLSKRGFLILMGCLCAISFVAGMFFVALGAWPVLGFFGLDILIVYLAFRWNYRDARRRQQFTIHEGVMTFRDVFPSGEQKEHLFKSYWIRIELQKEKLFIRHGQKMLEFGQFLIPDEKEEVYEELTNSLHRLNNRIYS